MSNGSEYDTQHIYRIRIEGMLDEKWSDWFDGFSITCLCEDVTVLEGLINDQGGLHGILAKVRDLGLPLLSVQRIDTKGETL